MCKYSDCIIRTVNPALCRECAENYQSHYLQKTPQFCPFCGYHHIVLHHDSTATCAKCRSTFAVNAGTSKGYKDEKWYDLPGCDGYQVSNYLRIYGRPEKQRWPYTDRKAAVGISQEE